MAKGNFVALRGNGMAGELKMIKAWGFPQLLVDIFANGSKSVCVLSCRSS